MKDLYIIGAGGFAREVAWAVRRINQVRPTWNLCGFIDNNEDMLGQVLDGIEVKGNDDYLCSLKNAYCVCAVGSANERKRIVSNLHDVKFASIIDPSVRISSTTSIGEDTIICGGTIITVDGKIGNHVIANLNCTIGHDVVIDDFVTLYPGVNVSVNVHLGECVELGTGSQIIQGLNVKNNTIVGAGGVIVKDIEESGTYVGVPVKRIK